MLLEGKQRENQKTEKEYPEECDFLEAMGGKCI